MGNFRRESHLRECHLAIVKTESHGWKVRGCAVNKDRTIADTIITATSLSFHSILIFYFYIWIYIYLCREKIFLLLKIFKIKLFIIQNYSTKYSIREILYMF